MTKARSIRQRNHVYRAYAKSCQAMHLPLGRRKALKSWQARRKLVMSRKESITAAPSHLLASSVAHHLDASQNKFIIAPAESEMARFIINMRVAGQGKHAAHQW